jgi:heat-inducible transcriptional repressor
MDNKKRKELIMGKLVDDYVETTQPVSSSRLLNNIGIQISSATVRNDLMKLETDGYVQHLYTSSGRVPTDKGYRLYVDKLMVNKDLSKEENCVIKESIGSVYSNISQLLLTTGEILSELSDYPVIIVTDRFKKNTFKFVQVILLNIHLVMINMLDNYGDYYQEVFELPKDVTISQQDLNKISEYLNNICGDCPVCSLEEIYGQSYSELMARFSSYSKLLEQIKTVFQKGRTLLGDNRIINNKSNKLLAYPEFQKIEALKNVQSILEDEAQILNLFSKIIIEKEGDVGACIGKENNLTALEETSFIAGKITIGDNDVARIGMIGPTRMNYGKVFAQIKTVMKELDEKVKKIFS